MAKRRAFVLSKEAIETVERVLEEASEGFDGGTLSASDVVNEMILTARVDVRGLQGKHLDLRRLLKRLYGKKDIDAESVLKQVAEFRGKSTKRRSGTGQEEVS